MKNRLAQLRAPAQRPRLPYHGPIDGSKQDSSTWEKVRHKVTQPIVSHPLVAISVGLTAGVILGCLVKRR